MPDTRTGHHPVPRRQLADQGRTVLVSSHVLAEVAQTVDQVVIIASGRLVTQSTLAALTARTDQLVRVRTPQAETLKALLAAQGIQAELDGADQLLVAATTTETVGKAAAAAGIVIYEMGAERSNLEDVFLQLTSPQGAYMSVSSGPSSPSWHHPPPLRPGRGHGRLRGPDGGRRHRLCRAGGQPRAVGRQPAHAGRRAGNPAVGRRPAARDPGHGRGVPPPDRHPDLPGHPRPRAGSGGQAGRLPPGRDRPDAGHPGVHRRRGQRLAGRQRHHTILSNARLGRVLLGAVLAAGLCGLVGVGVAALVRNQVAALVGVAVWVLLVEGLLMSLLNAPSLGKWLPSAAAAALTNPGGGQLSRLGGTLLLAGYGLALALAGTRLVVRRDIT